MRSIERILNFLAPYDCLECGREGSLLCENCQPDACPRLPSRCYRCKKLTQDFAVCDACRRTGKLSNVWVRTEYTSVAKELVQQLKFKSARDAAVIIAALMSEIVPHLPADIEVIPVPTATSRKRQRGYDHAEKIARELANMKSLHTVRDLSRIGQTRQVGVGRKERLEQLQNAFYVTRDMSGKTILLVDDVVTTRATLESAAAELKKAGAKKIYAVVFAQK